MPGIEPLVSDIRSTFVILVVTAKVLSALFSFALIAGITWLLRNCSFLEDKRQKASYSQPPQPLDTNTSGTAADEPSSIERRWQAIRERLEEGDEGNYQLAIIEADKLVDTVLKDRGYEGDSMGDRLKQLEKETFPRLDQLWYVHKVRNEIVHSSEYDLPISDAQEVLNTYERVLRDLEVI
jgi:hypothetical protein